MAVVAASSVASAAEYLNPLFPSSALRGPAILTFQDAAPGPAVIVETAPAPMADSHAHSHAHSHAQAIELYGCVKYEDLHHIAPCAQRKIVEVANPCWRPSKCGCCAPAVPRCVYVVICVPTPNCCDACCGNNGPKVTCRDGGRYVKYDYGKYRIEIRVKGDTVVVDYDD